MKKNKKKLKKIFGAALPVILIAILIGTSFQVFLTNNNNSGGGKKPVTIYLGFRINNQSYPYQPVNTYENTSIAQLLYTYTKGGVSLQSDGSIKCIGNICNSIQENSFWTTKVNNETITDNRRELKQNDYAFLIYE